MVLDVVSEVKEPEFTGERFERLVTVVSSLQLETSVQRTDR